MRFQKRDGHILWFIYNYGGLVEKRHIKKLLWQDRTERAMLKRLKPLVEHDLLARLTQEDRRNQPYYGALYWLGWRGAIWIAEQHGIEVETPKKTTGYQLRKLHRILRGDGIRWLPEPKWGSVRHDLAVVDFRFALERAVGQLPSFSIEQVVNEGEFRSDMDVVEFEITRKDGQVAQARRGVCPDLFFVITDEKRKREGKSFRLPLLLEMDMGSHPISSRFNWQKAAPYAAYVRSPAYASRFGFKTGTWLVVTRSKQRMENLMKQTRETVGKDANLFLFAYTEALNIGDDRDDTNLLTDPVWWQIGKSDMLSLIS